MNKCLYTIHFGSYDQPHEPFISEGWDYLLFTNRDDIKSDVWKVIKVTTPLPDYLAARYVYINSHLFIPKEYDYSLMIGGQIHLIGDLNKLDIDYDADFNMMAHPCRTCIYKEAEIIEKENIDPSGNYKAQIQKYRDEGFPEDYGLNACGIIGRKFGAGVRTFEKKWWHQVMIGSYRDQLSFDYIRWIMNTGISKDYPITVHNFATPYWDLLHGEIFEIVQHGTGKKL